MPLFSMYVEHIARKIYEQGLFLRDKVSLPRNNEGNDTSQILLAYL